MIKEAIIKLSKKQDLAYAEAEAVMDEIMSGQATPVQMSAYLTALALKGETIDEITASAAGMRAHCIKLLHNLDISHGYFCKLRRRFQFLQYFHYFFSGDRSRRCSGCKTWKQGSILQIRCSRCSGSTGSEDYTDAGTQCRDPEKDQHLLLVCAELSHCNEICGTDS